MRWSIDPAHSQLAFAVRHMTIATVRGRFNHFTFDAETNDAGDLIALNATVDASSIDTNTEQRDAHLRSADFLDAANHPTITFRSTRIDRAGEAAHAVHGDLTIRGITRPVSFQVTRSQVVRDPWGNPRAGAEVTGKINRKEWGLNWNQALEFGGVLVGDEVKFTAEVQALAERAAAAA